MQQLINQSWPFIPFVLTSPTPGELSTGCSQDHQQFHQHLKADQLDRKTLQLIVLQLQNYFALLCYLLFFPIETISNKGIAGKNSATSPLINPNPNPIQLSSLRIQSFVLPRWALWDHPERKQTTLQMPTSSLLPTH